jgi:hypothetical protein
MMKPIGYFQCTLLKRLLQSRGGEEEKGMKNQKILFIDTRYKPLFSIEDGKEIEVDIDNETKRYACQYLDETHVRIGGRVYHIFEFAEFMERNKRAYRPLIIKEA